MVEVNSCEGKIIGLVLIRAKGNLLGRSLEELDEIIGYLEYKGVKRDWIGYIVGRCPEILSFSVEELESRTNFYFDMGMDEKDFGTMLSDYPKALGYFSMEEMNQKVAYLKEFGLSNEDAGRLLAFKPHLMGCCIEESLLSSHIPFDKSWCFPEEYWKDILRPKYRYLRRMMVRRPLQDLIEFPRFFSYSLDERIVPRHKIMVENRVNFKLRYMLASSDDEFKQRVEAAVERRLRFESGVIDNKQTHTEIDGSIEKLSFDFQTTEILEEKTDVCSDYKDIPTTHIQNSV